MYNDTWTYLYTITFRGQSLSYDLLSKYTSRVTRQSFIDPDHQLLLHFGNDLHFPRRFYSFFLVFRQLHVWWCFSFIFSFHPAIYSPTEHGQRNEGDRTQANAFILGEWQMNDLWSQLFRSEKNVMYKLPKLKCNTKRTLWRVRYHFSAKWLADILSNFEKSSLPSPLLRKRW